MITPDLTDMTAVAAWAAALAESAEPGQWRDLAIATAALAGVAQTLSERLAAERAKVERVQARLVTADRVDAGWLRTEDVELALDGTKQGADQ